MRRRLVALALAALAAPAAMAQGGNRLWRVEVELEGPLERVTLDAGAAGRTSIVGPLLAGERRRLAVPAPLAPPLGLEGLASLAAPAVDARGGGRARVLGFAAEQPEARWLRLPAGLRARPRPPAGDGAGPRAPGTALVVVAAAQAAALALGARGRRGVAALALCAAAALAAERVARRSPAAGPTRLVDADLEAGRAVLALAARRALALAPDGSDLRLETVPPDLPIEIEVALARDAWTARAAGGLVLLREHPPGAPADVAPAWRRSAAGEWTRYERVLRAGGPEEERRPPGGAPGPDPPGWLRAGLPPGRAVLLGRTADGGYVRAVGGR